jgi:transposase
VKAYRNSSTSTRVNWSEYEREYRDRIKYVVAELGNIVNEASSLILTDAHRSGRRPKLTPERKTMSVLIQSIVELSNRNMSGLISLFGALDGVNISYKTIERAYSDEMVRAIIHNVFILSIIKKGLKDVDLSGDGTGYSLTVTKHYRTQGNKEGSKNFIYSFTMMDLKTGLYICHGTGIRSEKEAYNKAIEMLDEVKRRCGIKVKSERLDKYYSYQSTLNTTDDETVLYILPRKGMNINGPSRWRNTFKRLMADPIQYIREYYKRERSESGFSADKRLFGWKIWQKRDDRICTAMSCIAALHNLFRIGYT